MSDAGSDVDWTALSARASFASHRLVGWIYWDPTALEAYAASGIDNGGASYIVSRAAPLGPAGPQVVAAAFYSISPAFINWSCSLVNGAAGLGRDRGGA